MKRSSLPTLILLILYLSIPATAALAYIARTPIPKPSIQIPKQEFNGTEAYNLLANLTHNYPRRVVGTPNGSLSASWIASWFTKLGLNVAIQNFPTSNFQGEEVNGTNVYAISPGRTSQVLILLAHRDVTPTATQGADDNGSGTVILMELARTLTKTSHNLTYYFLSTDSEEINLGGSRYFAQHTASHLNITLALSIDEVGYKKAQNILIYAYSHQNNYTDLGTMLTAASIGETLNLPTAPQITDQLLRRSSISLFTSDSESFLAQGIQSYALADDNPLYPYAETPQDTLDQVSATRLDLIGQWVETLAYNLNQGLTAPTLGEAYLMYSDGYTSGNQLIIHLATYPLTALALPAWLLTRGKPSTTKLKDNAKPILLTFIIILASSTVPLAYRLLGLWPPASSSTRDFLTTLYAGQVLAVIAILALYSEKLYNKLGIHPPDDPESRRIWTITILSATFLLNLLTSPFATILFLALPTLLPPLAQTRRRHGTSLSLLIALLMPFPLYAMALAGFLIFGLQPALSFLISEISLGGLILLQLTSVIAILISLGYAIGEGIGVSD